MPSTDLAPARRARPHRGASRPAHLARPSTPARWEPPARIEPGAASPEPELLHPAARHFGSTSLPARHHWVVDTLMVLGGITVLVLLLLL